MRYYPPMRRKNVQVMKEFKGLSTLEKLTMNEDYATVAKNFDADNYPAMTVRQNAVKVGQGSYPEFVAIAGRTTAFEGGITYRLTYGFSASTGKIYMYNYGASLGWSETNPASGLSGIADIDYAVWNDKVYAVRIPSVGSTITGNPLLYKLEGNGVNIISIPAHFHAIETHDNRFYGAFGNSLYVSDYGKPDDFTTPNVTDEILLGSNNDDIITALKSGNGKLTIFRRNSMYELLGNKPSNFSAIEVAKDIGCVNHKSVTNLEGVTYFIDKKGVYLYAGGRPRKISEVVDSYFQGTNWTLQKYAKCSLETDGMRLFVNLGDDVMLVWNSKYNVWYEWNQMNVKGMLFNDNRLTYVDTNGVVYEFGFSDGYTHVTVPFTWEWVSKPMNTGLLSQRLRFKRLWLTSDIESGTFTVSISTKEEGNQTADFEQVQTVSGTNLNKVRTVIPTTKAANANTLRLKIAGSGNVTIHELVRESQTFPLK